MKPTANLRLRRAMQTAGLTFRDIAYETKANFKTVQRWVYEGRTPRRQRAAKVAEILGVELFWLWPELTGNGKRDCSGTRDSYRVYARASVLQPSFFLQLILTATRELFILTDSEWLLAQLEVPRQVPHPSPAVGTPLARLLLPPSFVGLYAPSMRDAEVRRHCGVMGTSLVRSDDTMILIPGGVGLAGPSSPVLLLSRAADNDAFDCYVQGFETLWDVAAAATPDTEY